MYVKRQDSVEFVLHSFDGIDCKHLIVGLCVSVRAPFV